MSLHNPEYRKRIKERFGYVSIATDHLPLLWVHAVSVGEVQASRPLINKLQSQHPGYQILITTMTPTGARTVEMLFGNSVIHRYIPYDLPSSVNRFLRVFKPVILIVMETEIWPNLFYSCSNSKIPVVIANARLSEKSLANYKRVSRLAHNTLMNVSRVMAQGYMDAERFKDLGVPENRIIIMGNLKFDIKFPDSIREHAAVIRRKLSVNRPIWIAASTHEGEEKLLLKVYKRVIETHKHCLLIIAPRHPERGEIIADLSAKAGLKAIRKSLDQEVSDDIQVYILDTLGELPVYYAASDLAFTGGSLVPAGGHNMLEPACLGVPVIMGPYNYNFTDISALLVDCGAGWIIHDQDQLTERVNTLLDDANLRHSAGEKGRNLVEANRGNVNKLVEILDQYLH